jgi:hypothetical protein
MKKIVRFENLDDLKETQKKMERRRYSQEELDEWKDWAEKWVEEKLPKKEG